MRSLLVQTITSKAALDALEPEWVALERSTGNTLPFRTFAWVSCWWDHLRESRLALHDSLAIRAVRTPTGRLVGVAPLMLTERPAAGPFRVRCLQFVGADPNVTEVRGPLCDPELEPEFLCAVNDDVSRSCGDDLDWVRWSGIGDREGATGALAGATARWTEGVACYVLDLPPTWEELRSSRPSNLREALRKCYASLRRDRLEPALEVVSDPADLPGALRDFLRLHAARAALEGTVHHNDVFRQEACRAFLFDVCARLAAQGAARVFRLRVGGELAATRIGFVLGGSLYLYYSGFEPAYARYGVATTLVAEAMKYAIAERLRAVNLSTGRDRSKARWRPRELRFYEALAISSKRLSHFKYDAMSAAERSIARSSAGRYAHMLLSRRSPPLAEGLADALRATPEP